jgi:hypothetical protein
MLPLQGSKPSAVAPAALIYITLGALLSVWSGVWFLYENNTANASRGVFYLCAGMLMTGIALLAIGFGLGKLAHKAQSVEIAQEAAKAHAVEKDPSIADKI